MSGAFDKIRKKEVLESPETVNSNWVSPSFSLDDRIGAFTVSIKYENGVGVDMKVFVQISDDDTEFGDIVESLVQIDSVSGTVLYDSIDSGAPYCRIRIEVTAGSIDVTNVRYTGTQFH